MAANRSNAAARLEPEPQNQPRSWATNVPYDELDQDNDIFQATPAPARHAAPTQHLRAVPKSTAPRARATQPEVETWQEPPAPAAMPTPKTGRLV